MQGFDFRSLTYTGTVGFEQSVATHTLSDHIAYCLREAGATVVEVNHDRVAFKTGMFRLNLSPRKAMLLGPFDSGLLTLDSSTREMAYRLSFRRLAMASGVMAAVMLFTPLFTAIWLGLHAVASSLPWYSLMGVIALTASWWALMVGLGLLWGIPFFRMFARNAVAGAPKYAQPTISHAIRPA